MLKKIHDYAFIFFVTISIIWHFIKVICLYYKPGFLKRLKLLPKETPTKDDLLTYYLLIIIGAFYILFKFFKQIELI